MDSIDHREDRSPLSSIAGSSSSSSHSIGANSSTSESGIRGFRYDSVQFDDSPSLDNSSSSQSEMENSASSEQMNSSTQNSDSFPPAVSNDFIAHHYNVDSMMSSSLDSTNAPIATVQSSVNDENGDRGSEDDNQGNDVEDSIDTNNGDYSSPIIEFDDIEMPLIDQSDALALDDEQSRAGARETMNLISAALSRHCLTPQIPRNRMTRPETGQLVKNRTRIDKRHQPLTLRSNTRLKITLRKWNVASTWKWCANDETCGICRMPFEACCIECKTPGDECPLAVGNCRHSFHMHCIVKWTEAQNTARPQCPLCRQEWRFAAG